MDIWDEIIKEYGNEIQNLKNMLGEGSVDDHQHYRQVVGSIHGIEWSRQKALDIISKINKSNEED
jgi:hypothetical protein